MPTKAELELTVEQLEKDLDAVKDLSDLFEVSASETTMALMEAEGDAIIKQARLRGEADGLRQGMKIMLREHKKR